MPILQEKSLPHFFFLWDWNLLSLFSPTLSGGIFLFSTKQWYITLHLRCCTIFVTCFYRYWDLEPCLWQAPTGTWSVPWLQTEPVQSEAACLGSQRRSRRELGTGGCHPAMPGHSVWLLVVYKPETFQRTGEHSIKNKTLMAKQEIRWFLRVEAEQKYNDNRIE